MIQNIKHNVNDLKIFFNLGSTKDISFRIKQLKILKASIISKKTIIENALWLDLHKSPEEAYLTEISIVVNEIDFHIKHLQKWAKPKRAKTPIYLFPSTSYTIYEPLGVALIIAPWNYPFNLTLMPLIGAISSGCCAMVKPSPASKHTSNIIEKIIKETFASEYINIIQGGKEINTVLLAEKWDLIFFTGSPRFGKVVYEAASKHLTPVILELGGKSPCIVDNDANIEISARRIVWGKLLNAGQTCIAPDYLLVHENIKQSLVDAIINEIKSMFGIEIKNNRFFPRIISEDAFDRICNLINNENIIFGGETNRSELYIAPTIIDNIQPDAKIMQEEIFGPIIPIMTFKHIDEVVKYINSNNKPLALYYFGNKNTNNVLRNTSSGGMCVNDTIMHIANHNTPFGGVGNSGIGRYHGKESFLAFSNQRSVLNSPVWIDLPLKYVPFKWFHFIKHIL